jgi:hypothetical protein
VTETEVGDEEGYYAIEVTLDDGSQVDVVKCVVWKTTNNQPALNLSTPTTYRWRAFGSRENVHEKTFIVISWLVHLHPVQ